eukprot:1514876-Pleurochrysis_carterae.AAC.2
MPQKRCRLPQAIHAPHCLSKASRLRAAHTRVIHALFPLFPFGNDCISRCLQSVCLSSLISRHILREKRASAHEHAHGRALPPRELPPQPHALANCQF